jgi:hypothetical protein
VTGGAGAGANTTVSIHIGRFDPASNETVLRTMGETGINRQQSQQGSQSKSHAEVASKVRPSLGATAVGKGQDGVLSEWVNTLGQTVQRTIDSTGNIVEHTLDATGTVLNDTTVGRLLDLPVINQTTNAAGQAVKLVHDTTGAVIECTLDNTGKIIDSRVVSKAPGASKRR